jgi:hypothetical protein
VIVFFFAKQRDIKVTQIGKCSHLGGAATFGTMALGVMTIGKRHSAKQYMLYYYAERRLGGVSLC